MSSQASDLDKIKQRAAATLDSASPALIDLSHRIHAHPELGFEEVRASNWCAELLSEAGFAVEMGVANLPTAFSATIGSGKPEIAICCEYDALPDIGHACGHNVIAAAAVGAGIALAELADSLGITIRVLGTPAEEGGGGKILMLDAGVFDGVGAAMMVHPAPSELIQMPCLAVAPLIVQFHGKEAHASAFPELGINAADAMTIAQVSIGLLRQHARSGDQVHGIVTNGGSAPNIVPGFTEGAFYVRSKSMAGLAEWEPRIKKCFEAGALASGASVEIVPDGPTYSEFEIDMQIATRYQTNAELLGRTFTNDATGTLTASTDMANVSLAIPSIHPTLDVGSSPAVNHQPEFAAHCVTARADHATIDGAQAMAWTIVDLATDSSERDRLTKSSLRRA